LLYTRAAGAEHHKEGLSLPHQKRATRAYVAARQGWIIAGEYEDIESGRHDDRPQYQVMPAG
jgi:Resolvase, N terminal domain